MSEAASLLLLVACLQAKHLVCDFTLQSADMAANKGTYGHPGGIRHAGLHGSATLVVLLFWVWPLCALLLALGEMTLHYHIDWAKDRVVRRYGFTLRDRGFWVGLGVDQFLHQWTYLLIAALAAVADR